MGEGFRIERAFKGEGHLLEVGFGFGMAHVFEEKPLLHRAEGVDVLDIRRIPSLGLKDRVPIGEPDSGCGKIGRGVLGSPFAAEAQQLHERFLEGREERLNAVCVESGGIVFGMPVLASPDFVSIDGKCRKRLLPG